MDIKWQIPQMTFKHFQVATKNHKKLCKVVILDCITLLRSHILHVMVTAKKNSPQTTVSQELTNSLSTDQIIGQLKMVNVIYY